MPNLRSWGFCFRVFLGFWFFWMISRDFVFGLWCVYSIDWCRGFRVLLHWLQKICRMARICVQYLPRIIFGSGFGNHSLNVASLLIDLWGLTWESGWSYLCRTFAVSLIFVMLEPKLLFFFVGSVSSFSLYMYLQVLLIISSSMWGMLLFQWHCPSVRLRIKNSESLFLWFWKVTMEKFHSHLFVHLQ